MTLPPSIDAELGAHLPMLQQHGYSVVAARYDTQAFGNWYVDLAGPLPIRIAKDRGQYIVDGDRQALESGGLWRAFEDLDELVGTLLKLASRPRG